MRVRRDGTIAVPPTVSPVSVRRGSLVSDGQGSLYLFTPSSATGPLVYYKLDERSGAVLHGPVTISQQMVTFVFEAAYDTGKLHFLWREGIGVSYYAQFDTVSHTPLVTPRSFYVPQGSENPRIAHVVVTNEGSHVNIILWVYDNDLQNRDHKVLFTQLDAQGNVAIPWTQMAGLAMGRRPTGLSKLAQASGRLHFVFPDEMEVTLPKRLVARIYDPSLIGSQNPNMGACNTYRIDAPLQRGDRYIVRASFGTSPGILLRDGRTLPLNPDALFFLSDQLLGNSIGMLDATGRANIRLTLPTGLPHGLQAYLAFFTFGQNIDFISRAFPLQIMIQCV